MIRAPSGRHGVNGAVRTSGDSNVPLLARGPDRAPGGRGSGPGDDGYATVLAAGAIAVVAVLIGVLAGLGAAMVTRHRAQVAADLAALAGATEAVRGREAGCARARDLTARNGATLITCDWRGWDLVVTVTRDCGCLPVADTAIVRSRAGPVVQLMP